MSETRTRRIIPMEHVDIEAAGRKLAQFATKACEIAVEDDVDEGRLGIVTNPHDEFVLWLTIDDIAVFRASMVPSPSDDGDGFEIHAYGTWLPTYRQFLPDPKPDLGDLTDAGNEADAGEETTDPDLLRN